MVAHTFLIPELWKFCESNTLYYMILFLSKYEEHKMERYSYKSMHSTPGSSYIFTKYNVWDTCNRTAQVFQFQIRDDKMPS